jgi:hypothetical protein
MMITPDNIPATISERYSFFEIRVASYAMVAIAMMNVRGIESPSANRNVSTGLRCEP